MDMPRRILIIEGEPALASVIQDYLVAEGMQVDILSDGYNAVETILGSLPDLVVLDIMLPGKDGLAICREVRAVSAVPIILETAREEEIDRLLGLELGRMIISANRFLRVSWWHALRRYCGVPTS